MIKNTLEKKFNPYIGCHAFIDRSNGHLIISSNGKAIGLSNQNHTATNGMFVGIRKYGRKKMLTVTFDGFQVFFYNPKFSKII